MRKPFAPLLGVCLLFLLGVSGAEAARKSPPTPNKGLALAGPHIVGAEPGSADILSITQVIQDLVTASNQHQMEGVLKHYSPRFVSGDNLTLEQVQKLIRETWKQYPDITYETQTLEIRVNGDWATVESLDTSRATAQPDPTIDLAAGTLNSRSRGMLFLKRLGDSWEIVSDYTLFETATILYGDADKLKVTLSTPDQVFAGEPYTAKVNLNMPAGGFAIATLSKNALIYPQEKTEDRFRTLSESQAELERVFQANTNNNNELVTASFGLTSLRQQDADHPTLQFDGLATIVKRINVLPKSKVITGQAVEGLVKRSASGAIDLTKTPAPAEEKDAAVTPPPAAE